jgi:hypothetical protein
VKRVLMVLAVALMMVAMAAPTFAKNIRPDGDGEPPVTSGNFPTFVFHCNTELRGGEGAVVFNNIGGGGNCL